MRRAQTAWALSHGEACSAEPLPFDSQTLPVHGPALNVRHIRQMLKLVEKGADGVELIERDLMPVRFVPLHDVPAKKPPVAQASALKQPPGANKAEL